MGAIPKQICKIQRKGYMFYLPRRIHPDKLLLDWLHQAGEFSLSVQLSFEKRLKYNYDFKHR